jgi:hypothetical protein
LYWELRPGSCGKEARVQVLCLAAGPANLMSSAIAGMLV